jgi:hypothetical protein
MTLIHISIGGPTYAISGTKVHYFEDHPYCGPMFTNKQGDEVKAPPPTDPVWNRINTWYRQGKKFEEFGGFRWCKFKTDMQEAREIAKQARELSGEQP